MKCAIVSAPVAGGQFSYRRFCPPIIYVHFNIVSKVCTEIGYREKKTSSTHPKAMAMNHLLIISLFSGNFLFRFSLSCSNECNLTKITEFPK